MLSTFKCDRCQEQISIEEYFTYLELKIPQNKVNYPMLYLKFSKINFKDPNKLKKWGISEMPREILSDVKNKQSNGWLNTYINCKLSLYIF